MPVVANNFVNLQDPMFSVSTLTKGLTDLNLRPHMLGQVLFTESTFIQTTDFSFDREIYTPQERALQKRGAQPIAADGSYRDNISLPTFQFARTDQVTGDDIQNKRQHGLGTMETLASVMVEKNEQHLANLMQTMEKARLEALQGLVVAEDGSVMVNMWTKLGLTQPTGPTSLNVSGGKIIETLDNIIHNLKLNSSGRINDATKFVLLADGGLYTAIKYSEERRNPYLHKGDVATLHKIGSSFALGDDCEVIRYAGTLAGLPLNQGLLVPVGVPDMYQTVFAPRRTIQGANQAPTSPYRLSQTNPQYDGDELTSVDTKLESHPLVFTPFPNYITSVGL